MAGLHGDHLQGAMHHHDLHGNSHHDTSMLHNSTHQLHHEPLEKLKRGESLTVPETTASRNEPGSDRLCGFFSMIVGESCIERQSNMHLIPSRGSFRSFRLSFSPRKRRYSIQR